MSYLKKYDILLVEDPFAEDDWAPCAQLTSKVDVEVSLQLAQEPHLHTLLLNVIDLAMVNSCASHSTQSRLHRMPLPSASHAPSVLYDT